jgi:hypothetical protein
MSAWRAFPKKHTPFHDLPSEFREVKGVIDPPHAEYSRLVELQDMVDSFISKDMQRALLVAMLAEKMNLVRETDSSHIAYANGDTFYSVRALANCSHAGTPSVFKA